MAPSCPPESHHSALFLFGKIQISTASCPGSPSQLPGSADVPEAICDVTFIPATTTSQQPRGVRSASLLLGKIKYLTLFWKRPAKPPGFHRSRTFFHLEHH